MYTYKDKVVYGQTDLTADQMATAVKGATGIVVQDSPFLEPYRPEALARSDAWRAQKEIAGIVYNGKTFQSDQLSSMRIMGAKLIADMAEAAIPGSYSQTWRATDNTDLTLNYAGIKGLLAALGTHIATTFATAKAAKDAIAAATTTAQIDAALATLK